MEYNMFQVRSPPDTSSCSVVRVLRYVLSLVNSNVMGALSIGSKFESDQGIRAVSVFVETSSKLMNHAMAHRLHLDVSLPAPVTFPGGSRIGFGSVDVEAIILWRLISRVLELRMGVRQFSSHEKEYA
ncbi:hypothetical protein M409DRAFT_29509 [Zasmidium cellare ATCC 36951]|uniref:Uncharacterized protein n=1 Tax=Zasmidium cellare ATCC 36951 TaxID=1080233 RepID=A0A6A6C1M7_ZASCE|nr:uncharacterized protein M409DRAFT_29509 [Zasmidium cellare ATCC 36951]KAF2160060.1 hypothetical protein M409DRAFT_29509 [Zasmidium cellare ATCC 36951]